MPPHPTPWVKTAPYLLFLPPPGSNETGEFRRFDSLPTVQS